MKNPYPRIKPACFSLPPASRSHPLRSRSIRRRTEVISVVIQRRATTLFTLLRQLVFLTRLWVLARFTPIRRAATTSPMGASALYSNTTADFNTAIGTFALSNNTTGSANTASGANTLANNTTGTANTAVGFAALVENTTGFDNTAIGYEALYNHFSGSFNTASGLNALWSNFSGSANTATGSFALTDNTTGTNNTATGDGALFNNSSGGDNTATGVDALLSNTFGANNTASGTSALQSNTFGNNNTATGISALFNNSTGNNNTAEGNQALLNNSSGNSNIAVGDSAGVNLTTGSYNIDIGNKGVAGEANTIRIGKKGTQTTTVIAGIRGTTVAGGIGVLIDANGRLGTTTSSARFKQNIQPMDKSSEAILALQPVAFRYKHDLDPDGIPQFGLVAEQVEKVNPDLVARDEQGKPYTVRYEAVNAMLLNEFLKAHQKIEALTRKNEEQESTNRELKSAIAHQENKIQALTEALKAQAAEIQKVSDQLKAQAPPMVVNN